MILIGIADWTRDRVQVEKMRANKKSMCCCLMVISVSQRTKWSSCRFARAFCTLLYFCCKTCWCIRNVIDCRALMCSVLIHCVVSVNLNVKVAASVVEVFCVEDNEFSLLSVCLCVSVSVSFSLCVFIFQGAKGDKVSCFYLNMEPFTDIQYCTHRQSSLHCNNPLLSKAFI